ncbi:caspase domain-containing protein [Nocardia tengchongensis]|uniref:caspase family protein n=1 Tax=Nocardia tengchongensis TaxID=2055889 RepID=UPI0036A73E78
MVLIGSAAYAEDSGLEPLNAVQENLRLLAEVLQIRTGIAAANIHVLLNPKDQMEFLAALRPAAQEAEDLLLFYFAGHGIWLPDSVGLAHMTTRSEHPEWSTVDYGLVRKELLESGARVKVSILDCCNSGNALKFSMGPNPSAALEYRAQITGSYVLTATDARKPWADARGTNGCTAFTGALIDILREPQGEDPEYLTMERLYAKLRNNLKGRNLPVPQASGRNTAGSLALVRHQQLHTTLVTPPQDVRATAESTQPTSRGVNLTKPNPNPTTAEWRSPAVGPWAAATDQQIVSQHYAAAPLVDATEWALEQPSQTALQDAPDNPDRSGVWEDVLMLAMGSGSLGLSYFMFKHFDSTFLQVIAGFLLVFGGLVGCLLFIGISSVIARAAQRRRQQPKLPQ